MASNQEVDDIAAVLWREELVGAGVPQSVVDRRTRLAFADESDSTQAKWRKYARAALQAAAAIPPSGEAVAQNDLPPHPEDFTHYALLRHHDRKRSCWIVVPEGQSLDFDEDDATRKWLHPYLGSEWHLFEFAILAAPPAPVAIDEAMVEGLLGIKNAADSFRDESGDEVAGQVILRVDALLAALNPQPNGGM